MSERVLHWKHLTGKDFASLDRDDCVVTVSVSPLEVHGPHLPTITDNLEGEALLDGAMAKLLPRYPRMLQLKLPGVFVASDVLPHRGSIQFRSSTVLRVVEDLGRSVARQGFKHIWVSNFHGGPRHIVPIEVACDRVNRRFGARAVAVFSLLMTKLTKGRTDLADLFAGVPGIRREDLVADSHGGAVETSLMLHLLGKYVDPSYKDLPRMTNEGLQPDENTPKLVAMAKSLRMKMLYYQDNTYAGSPALGTAELGEKFLDVLTTLGADALADVWEGKTPLTAARSPLWKARWFFLAERLGSLVERLAGYEQKVF